jgi:hypothetical protein
MRDTGKVRRLIHAERDEGHVLRARTSNGAATDDPADIRKQDGLEEDRRRVRRCAGVIIPKPSIEA